MRHGFLLIDKPSDMTSHDAVSIVRKVLHEPKIGHLGTLDPLATGLLVLAVGKKALKVIELFPNLGKSYEARFRFGAVSTTYDAEGKIEEQITKPGWKEPDEKKFLEILSSFTGSIEQIPPAHSAVHIHGKRAYAVIREDPEAELELPSRTVQIEQIQLISYAYPDACIRVHCSSGTYIRSLAHDMGKRLRCGAYLSALRRATVGLWRVENSSSPSGVDWTDVIPLKEILKDLPRMELGAAQWEDIRHGRSISVHEAASSCIGWFEQLPVAVLERDPKQKGHVKAKKVL